MAIFFFHMSNQKKILDAVRMLCKGKNEPLSELCKKLSQETDEYHKMDAYSILLKESIGSIINTEEEKELLTLFKSGGTSVLKGKVKGLEDFKLISFIVIK